MDATVASRSTFISGNAIRNAADIIKKRIVNAIIRKKSVQVGGKINARFENGNVKIEKLNISIPFLKAVNIAVNDRVSLYAMGWYIPPETDYNEKNGQGDVYCGYSYASNFCEVAVDNLTGEVEIIRFISAVDAGKIINPTQAEGQVQGGVTQGIGYALMERIVHDEGIMTSDSLSTYIIPSLLDVPEIKTYFVETDYLHGSYGNKGLGELPLIGAAPAIANAIANATGKRFFSLPVLPEHILN